MITHCSIALTLRMRAATPPLRHVSAWHTAIVYGVQGQFIFQELFITNCTGKCNHMPISETPFELQTHFKGSCGVLKLLFESAGLHFMCKNSVL